MGLTRLECITVREKARAPPGPAARSLSVNDSVLGPRQRGACADNPHSQLHPDQRRAAARKGEE